MKKVSVILSIIAGIFCISIHDFKNDYSIEFQVSELNNNVISVSEGTLLGHGAGYVELVWNTGDTGTSIIIDTPGIYIVSAKDRWTINNKLTGPYFLKGVPDMVKRDTIMFDNANYAVHASTIRVYDIIENGIVSTRTFRDTSWYSDGKEYFIETHAYFDGFWSGVLDTIIIKNQKLPLIVNTKVIIKDGSILSVNRWRESY